jgi:hypothetical protein
MSLMTDPAAIATFALAGNARLTLSSLKSGARFTYRIRPSDDGKIHFVHLLTGADNENDFAYLGIIRYRMDAGPSFMVTAKSRISPDAPSAKAFAYFVREVICQTRLPAQLEVRHENHCGRCGRALTVPESIDSGLGPDCREQMGLI